MLEVYVPFKKIFQHIISQAFISKLQQSDRERLNHPSLLIHLLSANYYQFSATCATDVRGAGLSFSNTHQQRNPGKEAGRAPQRLLIVARRTSPTKRRQINISVFSSTSDGSIQEVLLYYFRCMQQDRSTMQSLAGSQPSFNKLQQRASSYGCRWTYLTVTIFALAKMAPAAAGRCARCYMFLAFCSAN